MEHADISFVPLLIVITLAFLVPLLLARFKNLGIPVVVGEIIAGIIVGQSGLGLVQEDPVLHILSILGFAYLMFLSGLEINFSEVLSNGSASSTTGWRQAFGNPFVFGSFSFLLTLCGSGLAALLLWQYGLVSDPWIMTLILSTTSLGVVVPVLKERGLTGGRYGQSILISALVADFASILLISVYVLLRGQGLTVEILLVLVLFAAFVAAHRLALLFQRHLPTERIFDELSSATSQIKLRGSFALALVFIALAESLGIENILGAFLAGVIISFLSKEEGSMLRQKLDAIGFGFLIPIFFVMVGVDFDLPALLQSRSALLLVPMLLGVAYIVKSVPALLYRQEYAWRETLAAGILLSSRLSLIIAAAAIGLKLGLVSAAVNAAVILVAVISCTVSPIVFNRIVPAPQKKRDRVIVIGSSHSSALLMRRLSQHQLNTVLVPHDARPQGQTEATGNTSARLPQTLLDDLRRAETEEASTVIVMAENDETNLRICRLVSHTFGVDNIIAWVQEPTQNDRFRALGIRVLNPVYSTVLILESMVLNPAIFDITPDMDASQAVREVKLQNSQLIDWRLADLRLPGDVLVLMIERKGDVLVPQRDTALRANDIVTLVGTATHLNDAMRLFVRNE